VTDRGNDVQSRHRVKPVAVIGTNGRRNVQRIPLLARAARSRRDETASTFRRRSGGRLVVAMLGVVAVVLTACSSSTPSTAKPSSSGKVQVGGDVTMAASLNTPPNAIFPMTDAANATETNINQFEFLLYRPLYWMGSPTSVGVNYAESLANAPVLSADGSNTKVTITLKPYEWSNGDPVTSRDIEFWINLLEANKANWWDYTPGKFPDNIVSASYPSASTTVLVMKGSFSKSWILNELAQIVPIPQMEWDRESTTGAVGNYDLTPAGAKAVYTFLSAQSSTLTTYGTNPLWQVVDGPWKMSSYNATSNEVVFTPNRSWSGSPKPTISKLTLVTYTSDASEFDALKSGDIDYGFIPPEDAPQASAVASSGYTVSPWTQWNIGFIQLNFTNPTVGPIFDQLYVRQALQHLIDEPALVKDTQGGYGAPSNGIVPLGPSSQWLSPQEKAGYYPYSVSDATKLLSAHGWTKGPGGTLVCSRAGTAASDCGPGVAADAPFAVSFAYDTGVVALQEQALALQSSFAGVGIKLTLQPKSLDSLYGIDAPCTAGSSCPWDMIDFPGGWGYEPTYEVPTGSALVATGGADNGGGYSSQTVDTYLSEIDQGIGGISTFYKYENYIAQQLPMLWMPEISNQLSAVKSNLTGWSPQQAQLNITPETWKFVS